MRCTPLAKCSAADELANALHQLLGQIPASGVTVFHGQSLVLVQISQEPKPSCHAIDQLCEIRLLVLTI